MSTNAFPHAMVPLASSSTAVNTEVDQNANILVDLTSIRNADPQEALDLLSRGCYIYDMQGNPLTVATYDHQQPVFLQLNHDPVHPPYQAVANYTQPNGLFQAQVNIIEAERRIENNTNPNPNAQRSFARRTRDRLRHQNARQVSQASPLPAIQAGERFMTDWQALYAQERFGWQPSNARMSGTIPPLLPADNSVIPSASDAATQANPPPTQANHGAVGHTSDQVQLSALSPVFTPAQSYQGQATVGYALPVGWTAPAAGIPFVINPAAYDPTLFAPLPWYMSSAQDDMEEE